MRGVFDASAIVNLAINGGSKAIDAVSGGSGLTLTFFEIGNSVWKLHSLQKKLSEDDARSLLEVSLQLYSQLEVFSFTRSEALEIAKLASARRVTFYDSDYLFASKKENGLPLITDDERLARAARTEKIETFTSASII